MKGLVNILKNLFIINIVLLSSIINTSYEFSDLQQVRTAIQEIAYSYYIRGKHIQYDIYEESLLKDRASAQPKRNKSEQDDSKQDSPVLKDRKQLNIEKHITEQLKEKEDQNDVHRWRIRIENNIDYDALVEKYGEEKIDHLVELMLEVVISENPYCIIAKEKLPRNLVRLRMLKINSEHIEYVLDELDNTTCRIGNAKAYVLAALFNAPVNMDNQFQFEVNRDYPLNG